MVDDDFGSIVFVHDVGMAMITPKYNNMKLKYLTKTLKKKGRNNYKLHAFWNQVIVTTNLKNWFKQPTISHPHESINSRCTYWTLSIHPSEIIIYA